MSQYELNLKNHKPIFITEQEKKIVLGYWKPGGKSTLLSIGGNEIDTSNIISIHEITDGVKKQIDQNQKKYQELERGFVAQEKTWKEKTPYEKMKREAIVRIMPGLKLDNVTLPIETKKALMDTLERYFAENPKHSRAPMRTWWPIIKPFLKQKSTRWWEIVAKNDSATFYGSLKGTL